MALSKYNEKRDFKVSPEPKGKKDKTKKSRFVIQRHDASRLHYDFRLELDGVLKSWAVPKGPSLNPADKRLAVMVEDHPVGYINFEGTIPKGNYGAGTVMIWDEGTFFPINEKSEKLSEQEALRWLKNGQLKFKLDGKKLKGEFVLVQLKSNDNKNWLLIKHRDEFAVNNKYASEDYVPAAKKFSETSQGKSESKKAEPIGQKVHVLSDSRKLTHYFNPMLATLVDEPFDDEDWVFELKWDGYRAIAEWQDKKLKLYSRNGLSFIEKYPSIADAIKQLRQNVVLDGEIVLFNENNKPDFQKLQLYEENKHLPLIYYVFDLLFLNGEDLRKTPLTKRKEILQKTLGNNQVIKYCDHIEKTGKAFYKKVVEQELEGIIAKKGESFYTCGIRTREWLKIKFQHNREAIIVGYTAPRKSRQHFGALILAQYDGDLLKYIGHTGTGFTDSVLKELWHEMQLLKTDKSPFKEKIKVNSPVTWLKPKLVCQVHYTGITEGGMLRHPVYLGLRKDKSTTEVQIANEAPQKIQSQKGKDKKSKEVLILKENSGQKDKNEKDKTIHVDGHDVSLTNLNKIFWPDEKITKGDLIAYYDSIASFILPYLKDRPLSLKRNPHGITDKGFYHKDAGENAPSWVKTADVFSESANKIIHYIVCNNKASLLYVVNLGCIEMNPWNSTIRNMDNPDYLVIDLDPSDKNTFDEVIETANVVKNVLDIAGAECYCKTSGASGIHIYIPMGAKYTYDQVKEFGQTVATLVQQKLPKITSVERSLQKRGNKIYVDYLQNRKGQTLASAYSVRPNVGATVSTPLLWKEVKPGLHPSQFTIHNIAKRLQKTGDLFSGVLKKGIDLKKCLNRLR